MGKQSLVVRLEDPSGICPAVVAASWAARAGRPRRVVSLARVSARFDLLMTFGLLVATSGCLGDFGRSGGADRTSSPERGGTVRFQLAAVVGIEIQEVKYSIQAPDGAPLEGTVKVTADNLTSGILVENVPVSSDVAVSLSAIASEDVTCSGEGKVDVVAGQTAAVSIVLQCRLPDGALLPDPTGSISVQASVNLCPQVSSASAEAVEGGFAVAATAHDQDGDALTYAWSGASGSFADASAAATTYTCTESGDQTLTVTVSDDKGCTQSKDVVASCTVVETPPEQTPPEETPPEETPPEQTPPEETPPEQTPPEQTPPEQTPPVEGTELPCDVKAVLEAKCQGCHSDPPMLGAPTALVTLADLRAELDDEPGTFMYQEVGERIQSEKSPMPPKGLGTLTDDERATLLAWVDVGAPGADGVCEASTP